MRRRRVIWACLLSSFVAAHLPEPRVEAGGYRRSVVLHGTQFPEALLVLVDNSGSMGGDPYACAIRQARWVVEQATDGARVRFAAFGGEVVWQEADPSKWTKLPDAEAVGVAVAWLQHRGTGGSTAMAHAVEAALAVEEPQIGVVVISDCEPDGGHDDTRARIERANARRKERAVIGVISVAPNADAKRFAILVADAAGGPVVELQPKKDEAGAKR